MKCPAGTIWNSDREYCSKCPSTYVWNALWGECQKMDRSVINPSQYPTASASFFGDSNLNYKLIWIFLLLGGLLL